MPSHTSIQVLGAREVSRLLDHLGGVTARKIVRPALVAALSPINKQAKRNAKAIEETGSLAAALGIVVKLYRRTGVIFGAVGGRFPGGKFARQFEGEKRKRIGSFYLHLLEFGTRHFAARPILRPALDAKRGEALAILNRRVIGGIEKESARQAAKQGRR